MSLSPGLSAHVALVVDDDDTAIALRSGSVPVLATPRLIALCEEASIQAIADEVEEGSTTVGMQVQVDHLNPTAVGQKVEAEATLDRIEGRKLIFNVTVQDARGLVACGRVTRVVVDVERFLDKTR